MITQSKLHMRGVKDKDKSQSIVEETHRNSVYIEAKFDDQIPEIPTVASDTVFNMNPGFL